MVNKTLKNFLNDANSQIKSMDADTALYDKKIYYL